MTNRTRARLSVPILLIIALLYMLPLLAMAQPYPYTGNPHAVPGAAKLHIDGAYWYWYVWNGKEWLGQGRTFHRSDIARTGIDIGARLKQLEDAPISDRAALMAEFDKDKGAPCSQMIANAGYAARLCGAMLADLRENFPVPLVEATWAVKTNLLRIGGARPISVVQADGSRRATQPTRYVDAGTPCDCSVQNAPSGADKWCRVNAAELEVALCTEKK